MVELKAKSAFEGLLPVHASGVKLETFDVGHMTSLSPLGDASDFAQALKTAHGIAVPGPNRSTSKEGVRCIWFGLREVMLIGPAPDAALVKCAAVVDQSDGWAVAEISGAGIEDVLARLVPVDLRASVFKRGHTVRTQLQHMNASLTRLGPDRIMIMVFRSMSATLVHELKGAMDVVAARR